MIETTHDIWPSATGYSWEVSVYDRPTFRKPAMYYSSGWSHTKIGARLAIWTAILDWKIVIKKADKQESKR